MPCYLKVLLVFVISGCNAQNTRRLTQHVKKLERRLDFESNFRSHEIQNIYERLDEIDGTVNKSLENYEKLCSIESRLGNAVNEDVTNLETQDTMNEVGNDLVRLRRAFGIEKLIFAELRNTFPILRKQVERIQEKISDLQSEKRYLNTISRDLQSMTGNHSSEIQELGRVINDVQNAIELLTDKLRTIENKNNKYNTDTTLQSMEIQQLKLKVTDYQRKIETLSETIKKVENEKAVLTRAISYQEIEIRLLKDKDVEHQIKFENIAKDIERIKGYIDTYKTEVPRTFDDLDAEARIFSSCVDAVNKNHTQNGIYPLKLDSTKSNLKVYCDQVTDGGGWIVFQRRIDGSEDFYRGWEEYKEGFGNLQAEFWLGNEYLSAITATGQHELRIDMEDFDGTRVFAQYKSFKVDVERQNYKLEVSDYHGNASDSLIRFHSGRGFTTKDRDNDASDKFNCAEFYIGAWWYDNCHSSNLNGKYFKLGMSQSGQGINWYYLTNSEKHSLKFVEMKLR